MAWNDLFDRHVDAVERPFRPIPSGAVPPMAACALAIALSGAGIALAALLGTTPLIHALTLLVLVLLYNAAVKSTPLGPIAMGSCRSFNVLLGFSTLTDSIIDWPKRLTAAAIVGVYIIGISLFARDEAKRSDSIRLRSAVFLSLLAVGAAAVLPSGYSSLHPWLCAGLLMVLWEPVTRALHAPNPRHVQLAVKTAIFGLVALDTALAVALAGPRGLFVIFWLIPAVVLGRWLYST